MRKIIKYIIVIVILLCLLLHLFAPPVVKVDVETGAVYNQQKLSDEDCEAMLSIIKSSRPRLSSACKCAAEEYIRLSERQTVDLHRHDNTKAEYVLTIFDSLYNRRRAYIISEKNALRYESILQKYNKDYKL